MVPTNILKLVPPACSLQHSSPSVAARKKASIFSSQQKTNIVLLTFHSTKHTLRLHPCIVLWVPWHSEAEMGAVRASWIYSSRQITTHQIRNRFYTVKEKSSPSEYSKVGNLEWHPRSAADNLWETALSYFMCLLALKSEEYLKNNILLTKA